MSSPFNLSWALRPDPECGTRIIALWTIDAGTGEAPVDALEIDLLGQARRFRDQVRSEWIVIDDDAAGPVRDWQEDDAIASAGMYALLEAVKQAPA